MSNHLYNELNKQQNNDFNEQLNNGINKQPNTNLVSKFANFMSMIKGNPEEIVQNLLKSGQMTREQYNMLSSIAQPFFNRRK